MQNQSLNRLNNPVVIVLVILLAISVGYIVLVPKGTSLEETNSSGGGHGNKATSIESVAYIQAQSYVTEILETPSTAVFPSFDKVKLQLLSPEEIFWNNVENISDYNTDHVYKLDFYVDAQNTFGAMIRSEIDVMLRFKGGDLEERNNWKLVILYIDYEDFTAHFLDWEDQMTYELCKEDLEEDDVCNKLLFSE